MRFIYYFFALCFFCISISLSQSYWQRLNGITGSYYIQSIGVDQTNGTIYAGSGNGGGLFKSTNNGDSWTMVSTGLPVNVTVNGIAVSGGTVYAAMSTKLYRSTNAGDSWEILNNSPNNCNVIYAAQNGNIYVGAGTNGVHRSTDGGSTWTQISNGIPYYLIASFTYYRSVKSITMTSDGTLLCTTDDGNVNTERGVYSSTDNGGTWTRLSAGLRNTSPVGQIYSGESNYAYAAIKNNVFFSTDNGATWAKTDSIPVSTSAILSSITKVGDYIYIGITNTGVYRASLTGQGWTKLSSDLPTVTIYALASTPSGSLFAGLLHLYGYQGGMWRSVDSSATWTEANSGISATTVAALGVNNLGYIFSARTQGYIDRSTNGGTSFEKFEIPVPTHSTLEITTSFASNSSGAAAFGTSSGVYSSTDNGNSWARTSTQSGVQTMYADASGKLYAGWHVSGSGGGILRSTDNGQNWNSISSDNTYSILVTQAGTILSGSYNSGVNRSTDNGTNWINSGTTVVGTGTLFGLVQLPNGTIYLNGLLALFKSTDDGVTWTSVATTGIGQQLWRVISNGNDLLVGTPNGLYKSTDNGATWTNHLSGLLWTQIGYLAVDPSGYIYAGTSTGLYKSASPLGIREISNNFPAMFSLSQNYPNPFNPTTTIRFEVRDLSVVTLKMFDLLGREVQTLVNKQMHPGTYSVDWDANNVPGGVYFYTFRAGDFTETKRMLLMK